MQWPSFFPNVSSPEKKKHIVWNPRENLKLLSDHMDMNHNKCKVKYCLVYRLGVSGGMFVVLLSKRHY